MQASRRGPVLRGLATIAESTIQSQRFIEIAKSGGTTPHPAATRARRKAYVNCVSWPVDFPGASEPDWRPGEASIPMTPDLIANLTNPMLEAIRERLVKALASVDGAIAYGDASDPSRKIELALDIEVHTYEANVLLNALSLMNRVAKGRL